MLIDYDMMKFIWWVLVGILLIGFAITGGMDMGIAHLLPFVGKRDIERRVIINSVGPHWEGNQVWLITAGATLFAAWPPVYAAAFSGFYMAMHLVLFALIFRPLAFDYRSKLEDSRWRGAWDWALFCGRAIPSVVFGVAFGNLLQGVPFHLDEFLRAHYEGSLFGAFLPLLNPFALLCGVLSFSMLSVHGGAWLQMRTEDVIAQRARKSVFIFGLVSLVCFAIGGVWIAYGIEGYRVVSEVDYGFYPNPLGKEVERSVGAWMDIYSQVPTAMFAPALGFLGLSLAMVLSFIRRPGFAFVMSALGLAGIISTAGLSMFPFIMPSSTVPDSSLTVWDATSSHLTLTIMFYVVMLFLPIVLLYTLWCYRRMWGKVRVEDIEARSHAVY
ncbi:MAG: cytochrome d ubiquinol oxidase subunit II [Alphaproteobacteria bacterium]